MTAAEPGLDKITPHSWEQGGGFTLKIGTGGKSENKKRISRWIIGASATAGVIRGLALMGKGVVEKVGGNVVDPGEPMTTNRDLTESDVKYLADYQAYGLNDSKIAINLTNPAVVDRKLMQILSAETGGPGWVLPVEEREGSVVKPDNADFLAGELVKQLPGVSKQEVLDNWIVWHNDQQSFLNFLQTHGANQKVVNFWQCTLNLTQNDQKEETWIDRMPGVQACAVKAKTMLPLEQQKNLKEPRAGFFDIGVDAIRMAGGDPAEGLGLLETAATVPFDLENTIEMRGQDLAEIYLPKTSQLENSPLSLVMAGLFLVRIGPTLPKKLIAGLNDGVENVYFWFKLSQGSKMMRDLVILGRKWVQAFSKKDVNVINHQ